MRMLSRAACLFVLIGFSLPATAQSRDADDIMRLPGQGQGTLKKDGLNTPYRHGAPKRLVPGGGLMVTFDVNGDGRISLSELTEGSAAAFLQADANGDGRLTALEQQAWADSLPTRDDTLSNPARFDPNLDRVVSAEEFNNVISNLARDYAEEGSDEIVIANLKAKEPKKEGRRNPFDTRGTDRRVQR